MAIKLYIKGTPKWQNANIDDKEIQQELYQELRKIYEDNQKYIVLPILDIYFQKQFCLKDIIKYMQMFYYDQKILNILNKQLIELYFKHHHKPVDYNITKHYEIYGDTVALWLIKQYFLIPKQWIYQDQGYFYDSLKENSKKYYLPFPQHISNEQQFTIFDLAYFGQIPSIGQHKPDEQDKDGFTIAMILTLNDINIPQEWYHNPNIQNCYGQTVALIQASMGKIPDKQWEHNKFLRCIYYLKDSNITKSLTVQNILKSKKIQVPQQWQYHLKNKNEDNYATHMAWQHQILQVDKYNPLYQNKDGDTVAIILAKLGMMPPKEWMHNYNIIDSWNYNLKYYLQKYNLPIPSSWNDENMNYFDKIIFGIETQYKDHNPEEQYQYGWTVAMILARLNKKIPKELYHRPEIQNNDGWTVAMMQVYYCNQIPDKQWQHDPSIKNKNSSTVAMLLADKCIIPPEAWNHDPSLLNNCKQSVGVILATNNIIPPKQWMYDDSKVQGYIQKIQQQLDYCKYPIPRHWNDDNLTIFDQACYRIIPDIKTHKSNEQNENGFTIAMILAINKIEVPLIWQHKPEIQNKYGDSIFDIYVRNKQQPPKWCYRSPKWQNKNGDTQAMILARNKIQIPECLYHKSTIQNNNKETVAIIKAQTNQKIDKIWYHDPYLRDYRNTSVAMYQAQNKMIPEQIWYHNKFLRGKYNKQLSEGFTQVLYYTVQNFLQDNKIKIPKEWKYDVADNFDNTNAMLLAQNGIIPEKQQIHDPKMTNKNDCTVAQLFLLHGTLPPSEWLYNIDEKYNKNPTLKELFIDQQLPIPEQQNQKYYDSIFGQTYLRQIPDILNHKSNKQDRDGFTVAMILAINQIQIPKEWEHDPNIQNKYGMTVGMYLLQYDQDIPQQWFCKPSVKDEYGENLAFYLADNKIIPDKSYIIDPQFQSKLTKETVAMILAKHNQKVPDYCYHDPLLKDFKGNTVAMYMAFNGITNFGFWNHDIQIQNNDYQSIQSILNDWGYTYKNKQFIPNCKTQILNDTCQICMEENEHEFIITKCNHKICYNCFKQLIQHKNIKHCPVCRKQNWYYKISSKRNHSIMSFKINLIHVEEEYEEESL